MYSVSVYDTDLERQGLITTFVSLDWVEGYNTEGAFELELVLCDDYLELMQLEWYCGLTGHDTLMIIKSVEIEDDTIVVTGYPATHIFSDRVSTTVISNETAETAMRSLFSEMDAYPCFELGDEAGLDAVFEAETSDGTLQEYFETIAQACDLGFRMRHDKTNKKLLFEVYEGVEDENLKFSTLYGNMTDISYSFSSMDYKNVAVVAGQGEGDDRVTVTAGDTDSTGVDRREMYVDARNEQQDDDETDEEYEERLIAYGEGKLIEQIKVESISFALNDDDLTIGALVYCRIPEIGVNAQVRVVSIEETAQKNVIERTATLGTPVILKRY